MIVAGKEFQSKRSLICFLLMVPVPDTDTSGNTL
jgi:hypothetical protein